MNTELRTKAKNDFERDLSKLMSNSVSGKTMQNVRNHQDIKLVKADRTGSRQISKPNYYEKIVFRKATRNRNE